MYCCSEFSKEYTVIGLCLHSVYLFVRVSAEKLITLNDAKKSIRVGNFKLVERNDFV